LYVTTGDATAAYLRSALDTLHGKTLRLNDDGSIPGDNPFTRVAGARAEIFSYGHRNAQGHRLAALHRPDVQTEHGPTSLLDGIDFVYANHGGDEVNIVQSGRNYGWPVIHHERRRSFMETPCWNTRRRWLPVARLSIAEPCFRSSEATSFSPTCAGAVWCVLCSMAQRCAARTAVAE
jgi:glucose/arabinose dehydrogenase